MFLSSYSFLLFCFSYVRSNTIFTSNFVHFFVFKFYLPFLGFLVISASFIYFVLMCYHVVPFTSIRNTILMTVISSCQVWTSDLSKKCPYTLFQHFILTTCSVSMLQSVVGVIPYGISFSVHIFQRDENLTQAYVYVSCSSNPFIVSALRMFSISSGTCFSSVDVLDIGSRILLKDCDEIFPEDIVSMSVLKINWLKDPSCVYE